VAIVWQTPLGVEAYAAAGRALELPRFECPGCGQPMNFWGWYERDLRAGEPQRLSVRRQRCKPCTTSHSVLPSFMAQGRLDAVGVIGTALEAMAARPGATAGVARAIDLPYTTVRGWRRRFSARAELLSAGFARVAVALGRVLPRLTGAAEAVAIGAVREAWRAALRRFGGAAGRLWRFANAIVGGHLLTTNIHPPWSVT
jgi:Domain of unknown function (DUF6431)